ncbi:transcriptional regulator, XRE family [Pseudogulbenkiania sp. NH8B]|uniref:RodZ domain-containing protein n=1 Tax=Pseudogulbenkiania sp. (strain NH8B) TaxID=748280 RepID=UPI000227991F|nr:RodZ domain-containing protein [Pseudogulbenkiania sp. NH8B]BAK77931.1 transcriptional regulator, XRE family [Pseudogulbenkiania sp. NH8B]
MESQTEQNSTLPPDRDSVGAALKAAREAAGLSLGEVADRLKLSLKQLEAIEADRFEALPGAAFVRGFVRNYARFLGLDAVPLMARLEERFPSSVKEVANLSKEVEAASVVSEPEETSGLLGKRAILLVLVVVLAAGAFWFARPGSEPAKDEAKQDLAPMLTEQPTASAPVEAESVKDASAAVTAPAPVPAPAAKPAPAVAAAPASAPVSAPPTAGGGTVKLIAKQDAWVSVIDGSGKKLVFETLKAGAAKEVVGQPPFKLTVGNATQVEVSFNGQPVVMTGKIRGTTARLELK